MAQLLDMDRRLFCSVALEQVSMSLLRSVFGEVD
jgi:hypothetical protein